MKHVYIRCDVLPVAPVRQRGDDKAARVAQVLVAVGDCGGDHPHHDTPLLPVVPQLTDPVKVLRVLNVDLLQVGYHVSRCQSWGGENVLFLLKVLCLMCLK